MSSLSSERVIQLEDTYQIPTYSKWPIALERGEGVHVWDVEGRQYLDFYGGHCVSLLGHCPTRVVNAVQQQAETLLFYSNVAYSPIRAQAAALLAEFAPDGLGHVFFCNSGTEANETALKLARAWTGKSGVIAMENGFHGRTLGSLAATANPKYRKPFTDVLAPVHFVPFNDLEAVTQIVEQDSNVGAIILEPIQSMSGVNEATEQFVKGLRALCDARHITLIFDEVQTGVGRTGTFSISDQLDVKPDLISMAKSLASGLPIGATFVSDTIAATVKPGDQGSTFGGGMVAMAALKATLETIRAEQLMDRSKIIHETIRQALDERVVAIRGRGCLIGIELDRPVAPLLKTLREKGILAGSTSHPNTMRLMPPINTSDAAIQQFLDAFITLLQPVHSEV